MCIKHPRLLTLAILAFSVLGGATATYVYAAMLEKAGTGTIVLETRAVDVNTVGDVEHTSAGRVVPVRILGENDDTWALVAPDCAKLTLFRVPLGMKAEVTTLKVGGKKGRIIMVPCPEQGP